MSKVKTFEDLDCWKESGKLAIEIFATFEKNQNFSFKDQICRAVVSISNNIAEGFERGSDKDFRKFLYIAKGSCGEVRSMLYLALKLNYINRENFNQLKEQSIGCSALLSGLIKYLDSKIA